MVSVDTAPPAPTTHHMRDCMDYEAHITHKDGTSAIHRFSCPYDAVDSVEMVAKDLIKKAYGEDVSIGHIFSCKHLGFNTDTTPHGRD